MTLCVCVGEFLEDIHQSEESKLSPLCREITDNRVKSRKELDGLYQKITTYILLRSAMGSPTDTNTMEEATGLILLFIVPTTMSCLHTENVMPRYTKGCATNSTPDHPDSTFCYSQWFSNICLVSWLWTSKHFWWTTSLFILCNIRLPVRKIRFWKGANCQQFSEWNLFYSQNKWTILHNMVQRLPGGV